MIEWKCFVWVVVTKFRYIAGDKDLFTEVGVVVDVEGNSHDLRWCVSMIWCDINMLLSLQWFIQSLRWLIVASAMMLLAIAMLQK